MPLNLPLLISVKSSLNTGTLAWQGVNVVEVLSVGRELNLFCKSKDINQAFSTITELTQ